MGKTTRESSTPRRTYFPARLTKLEGQWLLEWLQAEELDLAAPFFEDTIRRARCALAENRQRRYQCVSTLDFLTDRHGQPDAPTAIVHHVSRCGSTLLTQLFSQLDEFCCLSEVPLFDQLLAIRSERSFDELASSFAAVLASLSTKKSVIIKTDSWHLFHADFYQACFPDTPTVLLYRNPIEVWRSHVREPGSHVVPGLLSRAQLNGALSAEETALRSTRYFAAIMAKYLRTMRKIYEHQPQCLLVNYNEGPESMIARIAGHIGMQRVEEDLRAVNLRAKFDSKHPQREFTTRPEVNDPVNDDTDFLDECLALYDELDRLNPYS